jgi:hypothetical protein
MNGEAGATGVMSAAQAGEAHADATMNKGVQR